MYLIEKHQHTSKVVTATTVCTNKTNTPILLNAATAISEQNVQMQQQTVAQIEKLPNYQQDPNCLYPIVKYYIQVEDAQNAGKYLALLQTVYHPNQVLSNVFMQPTSLQDLQAYTLTIEKNTQSAKEGMLTYPGPR